MTTEPEPMREIHEIRQKLRAKTANMTPEEHTAFYRSNAEEIIKKHGLNLKRPAPSLHDTRTR